MTFSTLTLTPGATTPGVGATAEPALTTVKENPVTRYHIAEHHRTHTCPANPTPHAWDVTRTILRTEDTGPCLTRITLPTGATIPCGRHESLDRQCAHCRTEIVIETVTTEHTGPHTPVTPGPSGNAPHPCDACGLPLAAVLAESGRHIGCQPPAIQGVLFDRSTLGGAA